MAESRRVEFQTITTPKEEKKSKHRTLIPRFNLALGESTSRTCPEFSFTELVKKEKVDRGPDVTDPFGNEDDCHDEVAALAKKFEEKYGPKPGKKKRKLKCLEDDYFDLGDGYDESDPFIDNTEAYDEVVPSCMTTIHGGFYINRGTLDFRPVSDHEDSEAEFITPVIKKRGRPRKIADSEDSQEGGGGEEVKKKKLKRKKEKEGLGGEKKKKRKLTIGPDGDRIVKRKKLIDPEKKKKTSPTVKELLKHQTASTATLSTVNGSTDDHPAPTPPHHSPTVDKPDVADRTEGTAAAAPVEGEEKKTGESEIQLPLDLPPELETAIVDIKKAAKDSKEGKCKFFSPHVNKLLLDIELASRQLPPGKRPLIYAHLADHLPCGKETLIKRAKKLRENQQDDQLKAPIQRLKEEIDKVMPALQEQHDKEVAKARLENKEKREGGDGQKEEGGGNTESDDDEKNVTSGVTPETQSRKGNRDPRKKFKWTPQIRSFLCDIVRIKMHMFDTYKFRNQTAEEYLKTFLDNEVKVLWPQGWIQTRMLFKETRSVHGNWTNPAKPKRQVLGGRSAASPTPTSALSTNTSVAESATSPSAPSAPPAGSGDPEVIEVSDIDEPLPAAAKDRVRATAVGPDEVPRTQGGSNLKFSPNTMEAVAAATAAAVAAAMSPKSETLPSLGERRPHLMSEMLKRPGNTDSSPAIPRPPASVPKTPPASDSGVSPFMAEFNRYLSNSNSMPPTSSSSRQGPSTSPPIPPSGQLQSRMVSSSTGRTEDGKAGHTLPTRWKVEEGVGTDRPRKPTPDVPPSVRPPNAHSGHKGPTAELSPYAHYKLMTSVLAGSEVNPDFPASPPMKTKGEAVRDQILAKIQAEMDAAKARGAAGGPSAVTVPGSQQRQAPPPAHTSRHSPPHPVFPSPPSELGNGGGGISRQLPPARPSSKPPGINNASVLRQPSPAMPPYTPKHSAVNAAAPASRPPHPVSRPSPSVSRSSPVARQSPKVVTRLSPSQGTQPAVSVGRQSPKTVSRALPGNLTRSAVVAGEKTSPGAGVGATRSITGAAPSQPLMSSFHSQHSSPTPLPPQRPPTSFTNSASLPSVCVRPLSLPAQKKPSHAPPPPPSAGTGNPPQPALRVSTSLALNRVTQGQGQNVSVTAGQGQLNSQARVTAGQGALQKSLPVASVPVQRHLAPSQTPQGGHRGVSLPQGTQSLPRGAPGGVASRGQGVGPSPGPPKVRPAAAAVDTHNRPGSAQRSQGDKAATSLSPANQGSKSASSTPHSRPAPQAPGIPTNSLRLQQPAAAVKGVASKASVTHSGTSATLPQPASLTPQTVDPPKPPPGLSQ